MTGRHRTLTRRTGRRLIIVGLLMTAAGVGFAPHSVATDSTAASSPVTVSRTVSRVFEAADGTRTTQETRQVTLNVAQSSDLHSLQLIDVSWSGAHPTGGLVADQNSDLAMNEEYPMVLMECRGTDTATTSITPDTCWTQYADERFNSGSDDPPWPAWRSDLTATAAERQAVVDAPDSQNDFCKNTLYGTTYQRWVPFDAANGTTYAGGPFGCAGLPPEAAPLSLGSNLALPSNETYGVTAANGTGSARFDIFTAEDHASLGCSQSVACSLVAVPVVGLSCDPTGHELPAGQRPQGNDAIQAATESCEAGPNFAPGQQLPSQAQGSPAVDGQLWWSPSNWANRISVPLSFATPDDACSLTSSGPGVDVYGSEMLAQATTQWAPRFCLDSSLFDLNHVQTPEPQARSLLAAGNIDAAYTSEPPDPGSPYPTPTVNAPVAISGFGIAFSIDDDNGNQVQSLRLTPRLLAKLMTESYPSTSFIKNGDPGLAGNPLNISYDPEFQALNPGIPETAAFGAATLDLLNTDSDVIEALTSYVNADPEARAWLNGAPDPWGMVVNPAYKGIALPVNNWPLSDSYEPKSYYQPGLNDCLAATPVPYLPLVAAPTARLYSIAQNVQFALSPSQTVCVLPSPILGDTTGSKMVAIGRQPAGHQFMVGLVSLGDAARDGLDVAQLETQTAATAPVKFTDATGRSFATADDAGLAAAADALQPDDSTGTWPIPYATLRTDPANVSAYPGTMIVYAAMPVSGLSATNASRLGLVLLFEATSGQIPGDGVGQLPNGFLSMLSNPAGTVLARYSVQAALAVAGQTGVVPPVGTVSPTSPTTGDSGPSGDDTTLPSGATLVSAGDGAMALGRVTPSAGAKTTAPAAAATGPKVSAGTPNKLVTASTPTVGSGIGGWVVPVFLIIGLTSMLAGVIVRVGVRR